MNDDYRILGNDLDGYTVTGPGLQGRSDVPTFKSRFEAESACRCFAHAFVAGALHRSNQFKALIEGRGIR